MFKIGTLADWFGVGLLEGIRESQRCGAAGVQIYAWKELNPLTVSKTEVLKVKDTARGCGQEIVALCGELGGHGFAVSKDNPEKVDYLKRVVDMALVLDCSIVTTHIGVIPEDVNSDKYKAIWSAGNQVAEYAAKYGVTIAVETGPEPVERLSRFIKSIGCEGIGINYDPANLVMVTNDDEVQGVFTGGSAIVHTHAKDGRCNHYAGPEEVYDLFAEGGIEALNTVSTYFTETPLGQGNVRWPQYLSALKEIGYRGYLTIEREVGQNVGDDIRLAVNFLRQAMEAL